MMDMILLAFTAVMLVATWIDVAVVARHERRRRVLRRARAEAGR